MSRRNTFNLVCCLSVLLMFSCRGESESNDQQSSESHISLEDSESNDQQNSESHTSLEDSGSLPLNTSNENNTSDAEKEDHPVSAPVLVKVYQPTGGIQCESQGVSLESMERELAESGIRVICSQKGSFNVAYAAVCGHPDYRINIFTINLESVEEAKDLGYDLVTNIEPGEYIDMPCEPESPGPLIVVCEPKKDPGAISE